MLRRVHLPRLTPGTLALPPAEAHHIRDVLRLEAGTKLELFDDTGNVADGVIKHVNFANVVVDIDTIRPPTIAGLSLTVAAAVPKGDRADWMVEKLTELGVARFIPLAAERSVVLPAGKNKIERWERIAVESAKQSRRTGLMAISHLTPLNELLSHGNGIYLSTADDAMPISQVKENPATILIGPEGGWSAGEVDKMNRSGWIGVKLTSTILRVETAAVVAAGVLMCRGG